MAVYYVYIVASGRHGTLYVGMANDIARRAFEHREGVVEGFTKQYSVHRLVHVETFDDPRLAIAREKRLKRWLRAWKIGLIEKHNSDWDDLFERVNM